MLLDTESMNEGMTVANFSIGICATDQAINLPRLIETINGEKVPSGFLLNKIIVVASGCSVETISYLRRASAFDRRLIVVEEETRGGKAEAVNKIIQMSGSMDYILFINSDALPSASSISRLLTAIDSDKRVGVVSACPVVASSQTDTTFKVESLMWNIHNESSLLLNHMQLSNHSSDEMMIMRPKALHGELLPVDLVNDGAYLAGIAKLNGYLIRFCAEAKVAIDVPRRWIDLISQRRRILYGHMQVWRLTGRSPKTIESLLLSSPSVGMTILVKIFSKYPKLIFILPFAITSEVASSLMAMRDLLGRTKGKHRVWYRYGN